MPNSIDYVNQIQDRLGKKISKIIAKTILNELPEVGVGRCFDVIANVLLSNLAFQLEIALNDHTSKMIVANNISDAFIKIIEHGMMIKSEGLLQ